MKGFLLACVLVVAGVSVHAQSGVSVPLASLSTQPSMNVFRRFALEPSKMAGFYADVLGLKQLPSLNMPGGGQMMLFEIGSGQVKLQFTAAAGEYKTGRRPRCHGVACIHLLLSRRSSGHSQVRRARLSAPEFRKGRSGTTHRDGARPCEPMGRARGCPNAAQEVYQSLEFGLTVSISRRAVRSIASSSDSRSCHRFKTRCLARHAIRIVTELRQSRSGVSAAACRRIRAAPGFSTWYRMSRRLTRKRRRRA